MHVRATVNTGASVGRMIREALMHVAVYAGVPAANSAFEWSRGRRYGHGCPPPCETA